MAAGLIVGLIGIVAVVIGLDPSNTSTRKVPSGPLTPTSPAALAHVALGLSDFPTSTTSGVGWTAANYEDPTVFGVGPIAHDFGTCLHLPSTLLGEPGPGGRAFSAVFMSGPTSVESLVAVEPNAAIATEVIGQMKRARASTCVTRRLTAAWRTFGQASKATPTVGNLFVTVVPLTLHLRGQQATAFTICYNNRDDASLTLFEDVAAVREGQKDALLVFFTFDPTNLVVDPGFEESLEAKLSARLRALALVPAPVGTLTDVRSSSAS